MNESKLLLAALTSSKRLSGSRPIEALEILLKWTARVPVVEFNRRLDLLGQDFVSNLRYSVDLRRKEMGAAPIGASQRLFMNDLAAICRAAALRVAQECADSVSIARRKALVQRWVPSRSFDRLSDGAWVADECVDRLLGLNERLVKRSLARPGALPKAYRNQEIYLDSTPEDLFTPYRVLREIYKHSRPHSGDHFVDLGSGLGRVGIYGGLFYPKVRFSGYELMEERNSQAARCTKALGLSKRVEFHQSDLSRRDFEMPDADYFFMFNPFSRPTLQKVFRQLEKIANRPKGIGVAIVRIGRPPRWIQREPWLKLKYSSPDYKNWPGIGFSLYHSK